MLIVVNILSRICMVVVGALLGPVMVLDIPLPSLPPCLPIDLSQVPLPPEEPPLPSCPPPPVDKLVRLVNCCSLNYFLH